MAWKLDYIPAAEFRRILSLETEETRKAALFADACRINALYMIMKAGSGHIGSSFSAMDLFAWLYLHELDLEPGADALPDIFFSSKGHDAPGQYAVLLGLGKLDFELVHALRRLKGLPGHPEIGIPFMEANTGSLGMGISKAKGMIHAARLQRKRVRALVLTGDGELQEGQIWESLPGAANKKMGELTVIVDYNKIQSDTWVEKVSSLGDLEAKFRAFGWHVARCDGNDMAALARVFRELRSVADRPKVLIADTVKGKGVSFMEKTSQGAEFEFYNFHSGAPAEESYSKGFQELRAKVDAGLKALAQPGLKTEATEVPARVPPQGQRMVRAYSQALIEQAGKNPGLVALDADLMLDTGLIPFQEKFPERFIECGIAEQDMVSQAGGLALKGFLPICHSFACFLSTRPNEQIYANATEKTKIIYTASLAGLLPSQPGHTHQSVRDISCLGGTPDLVLLEPSCEKEVGLALDFSVNRTMESSYLRLVSIPCDIPFELPPEYRMELGRGVALTEGKDAVLIAYGPVMLTQAYHTASALRSKGIGLKVVNLPWLNRVDSAWLAKTLAGCRRLFTLDNHYLAQGQGEMIAARVAEAGLPIRVTRLGLAEVPLCGTNDEVLAAHGLNAASLAGTVEAVLRGNRDG